MGDSKFQVGDIITIKRLRSEDDGDGTYRFGLNGDMIALSGKSFKIEDVRPTVSTPGKLPDDGYKYELEGEAHRWSWASSMFEDTTEGKSINIDAFVNKKKCPILDFTLH